MTAVWVVGAALATMWTVGPLAYLLGHRLGLYKGHDEREELTREWRILFDELGAEHGTAIDKLEGDLAKADGALADLQAQIPVVFCAGQVFQAERKDAGL